MPLLTKEQIKKIGLKLTGKNVKISDKASFWNPSNICIGDNSRIDDFCVLSAGEGGIEIGKNVHIAVYTSLIGKGKITIEDFSNLSSKISIYSSNDDYSGNYMTNPTVNEKFTNVTHGPVIIKKHAIVGSGSIILPNVILGVGACVGALSLIKEDCVDFGIYAGSPAKYLKQRSTKLLELEKTLMNFSNNTFL